MDQYDQCYSSYCRNAVAVFCSVPSTFKAPTSSWLILCLCDWVWTNITQQKAKHTQTFSIVAMYTDFFLRLLRGGIFPRLAAYSSTKKPSSTANWVKDLTCLWVSETIKTCIRFGQATFLPLSSNLHPSHFCPGLSLSYESTEALIFAPVTNLLPFRWIVSTIVHFTCNIKGQSNIPSRYRC